MTKRNVRVNFRKGLSLPFFLSCMLLSTFAPAQFISPDHRTAVRLSMDNDYFVWFNNYDRYYSYGISLRSESLRKDRSKGFLSNIFTGAEHATNSFEAAIKAYTPDNEDEIPPEFDRPFAGWSYFGYKPALFFGKSVLSAKFMIGVLGENSQAGQLQNWFHEKIEDERYEGWENQVNDKIGYNIEVGYYLPLIRKQSFELYTDNKIMAGNIFAEIRPALGVRIGRYRAPNRELYESREKNSEFFFQLQAAARYAFKDATVESGPGFEEYYELNNLSGIYSASFHYSTGNFLAEMGYVYTNGSVSQQSNHNYGSITLGWLF